MKTATVADLRNHFPKIAAWLEAGEEVRVTRRGKPLAKIVPDLEPAKPKRPDIMKRLRMRWGDKPLTMEEVKWLKEKEYEGSLEDLHELG
jgi:antitoxin (DNA-binding transcriptional repressor) of toxin-antitoxin stability system